MNEWMKRVENQQKKIFNYPIQIVLRFEVLLRRYEPRPATLQPPLYRNPGGGDGIHLKKQLNKSKKTKCTLFFKFKINKFYYFYPCRSQIIGFLQFQVLLPLSNCSFQLIIGRYRQQSCNQSINQSVECLLFKQKKISIQVENFKINSSKFDRNRIIYRIRSFYENKRNKNI